MPGLYADDTQIYTSSCNLTDLVNKLNHDLESICTHDLENICIRGSLRINYNTTQQKYN